MKHALGKRELIPQNIRAWLYRVALAVVPLLIVYGVLDESSAPLWAALVGAVLASGSAVVHTPTVRPEHSVEVEE